MMQPMKAEEASESRLTSLCGNPEYAGEPKVDGDRCLVHVGQGKVYFASSTGKAARYRKTIERDFEPFRDSPISWVFDGELLDGKFYVFDLVEAGSLVTKDTPFWERREILEGFFERWEHTNTVVLLPSYTDHEDKAQLALTIKREGGEGLMFKRLDSLYRPGKRCDTWLKVKYRKDIDCVVVCSVCEEVDCEHQVVGVGGKNNMVLSVYRDDKLVHVGECTSLAGDGKKIKVGDVVCVRILYVSKKYKLTQPTLPRLRVDKERHECTWDQLPPLMVNKTVYS